MLDGIAASGSGTERRFYLEQARHYPMRRLGGEVIERAWRNARDAVAREGVQGSRPCCSARPHLSAWRSLPALR
jgi:hypothetical protein